MTREEAEKIVSQYKPIGTLELVEILERLGLLRLDDPEDFRLKLASAPQPKP